MQIRLSSEGEISLPLHYQAALQGFIYSIVSDERLRKFLHDEGFVFEKRKYKPFTFSNLKGKYEISGKKIVFYSSADVILSTFSKDLAEAIAETFAKSQTKKLGDNDVEIEWIKLMADPDFEKVSIFETLSPITVYSTLKSEDGRKYTRYYDKKDPEFARLIYENLLKKAKSVYGLDLKEEKFELRNVGAYDPKDQKHVKFKGFTIKAWNGRFKMSASAELKRVAYELGVGAKNAQGFGCVKFLENKSREKK